MTERERLITGPQLLSIVFLFALAVLAIGVWNFIAFLAAVIL